MLEDEIISVDIDYKALEKELSDFDAQMPNVARRLMRAVNNEIKKEIRAEARNRGYAPSKYNTGKSNNYDSGYKKNLKSYADRGYKGKIMFKRDAYYYKWIEYGANVPERKIKYEGKTITLRGFTLPARPLIHPIANSIWGTEKGSQIMEKEFQKAIDDFERKGRY